MCYATASEKGVSRRRGVPRGIPFFDGTVVAKVRGNELRPLTISMYSPDMAGSLKVVQESPLEVWAKFTCINGDVQSRTLGGS